MSREWAYEGTAHSGWAWYFGLGAFLLFALAAMNYLGYIPSTLIGGWAWQQIAAVGVLVSIAGAAVWYRENGD